VLTGDIVYNLIFGKGVTWDEVRSLLFSRRKVIKLISFLDYSLTYVADYGIPTTLKANNADAGWSRASVPFAISERNANCVLNGLMLFAYKSDGAASAARFQITQETCMYFKVDYWGQLAIDFEAVPASSGRYAAARQAAADEAKHFFPSQPLVNLASKGVDPSVYGKSLTQIHVTTRGVVYDGVNYVGECITRTGGYAGHCAQMVVPSYSTAKAIFAGFALMRLAEKFGAFLVVALMLLAQKFGAFLLAPDASCTDVWYVPSCCLDASCTEVWCVPSCCLDASCTEVWCVPSCCPDASCTEVWCVPSCFSLPYWMLPVDCKSR
jgi:hypothetical protein